MKNKTLLTLLVILSSILSPILAQKIVGYLPYYRGVNSNFDYSKYTHIHYFSIWPAADGSFIYPQSMDSLSMATQFHTVANAAQPSGTKMIMTFGGTAENGSAHFIDLASNPVTRANFVSNVEALCDAWSIDGIDIDWEWNQPTDVTTTDMAYLDLMTDMRTLATAKNLSLSVDVSPSSWNGKFSKPAAVDLADYVNVMSYSYNGAWSSTTGHHSSMDDIINVGLKYWLDQGISASKLNLGSAFYGFTYEGTTTPGTAYTSVTSPTYIQITDFIQAGYTVVEDDMNGTYCYSTAFNRIVFYDSEQNVAFKMEYAMANNYGGVIIWEIGEDTDQQILSNAIYNKKDVINSLEDSEDGGDIIEYIIDDNELNIKFQSLPAQVEIIDIKGNVLLEKEVNQENVSLDLKNVTSGLYILKTSEQGAQHATRISINH